MNYNSKGETHKGARDFVFWHLCQIQYKNPEVQVLTFMNITPSPFIRMFLDSNEEILVDVENKSREEICNYLKKIICKSDERLSAEAKEKEDNPANFGWGCERQCICEIPGQVPCTGVVPVPMHMRGKYKHRLHELKYKLEDYTPRLVYHIGKRYQYKE